MRRAIDLAVRNVRSGHGGPFGAVVVRNGEIIAEGVNAVTATNDPTAHAEIVAIREACRRLGTFRLDGCELYCSCEPCPMCLGAIYWAHIDRVFYGASADEASAAGFDDDFIYRQISIPPPDRVIPMRPLLGHEAMRAFDAWNGSESSIPY